jgi:hypothetical protein
MGVKSIHQLVPDIQHLVTTKGWMSDELSHDYGNNCASRIATQYNSGDVRRGTLRLSRLGPTCPRAFWYSIHHPELAEPLPPWAEVKFSFGHTVEALALTLAKAAGHTVEGEQDELTVDGITGHRDCVIDGCLVDIKSSSTRMLAKLKSKELAQDDPFGYLDQLDGYSLASISDPMVKVKDRAYILAIDKTLGHMVLYEHKCRHEQIKRRIAEYRSIVEQVSPPACQCGTRHSGSAGNIELDIKASYSAYKYQCFPNLRTFAYANGPIYLTKVVREPNVPEIKSNH